MIILKDGTQVPTRKEDVIEDYTPVIFARVSSRGQKDNLPVQVATVEAYINSLGFKKKPLSFAIQQSGFKGEQQNIKVMRELREENPDKKYVAVFRAVDRIGRDTEIALRMRREMSDMGVPVLAMNLPDLTGKKPYGNRSVDILYNILSTVAETGKETELAAMIKAAEASAKKGVLEGSMLSFYPEGYTDAGGSIYRQIWEGEKAIEKGLMSRAQFSKNLGFVYTTNSPARKASKGKKKKRLGEDYRIGDGNTSQPRKIIKILKGIAEKDPETLQEYLDVVDAVVMLERKNKGTHRRDIKPASLRSPKSQAMHRVTVAYFRDPFSYPNPILDGNPEIATIVGNTGEGTLQDAYDNPATYLPKSR